MWFSQIVCYIVPIVTCGWSRGGRVVTQSVYMSGWFSSGQCSVVIESRT